MKTKVLVMLVVGVLLSVASIASANPAYGINILEEQYHVWGHASQELWDEEPIAGSYDISNSSPVNASVVLTDQTYAYGSAGLLFLDVLAASDPAGPGYTGALSEAEAYITFQPQYGALQMEVDMDFTWMYLDDMASVQLKDLTTNSFIYDHTHQAKDWMWLHDETDLAELSLDITHEYGFRMYMFVASTADGRWGGDMTATLSSVPAPSAILLGSIGAALVGWLRRRKAI